MLQARILKHTLEFKRPSGTSRGVLTTKDSWFITLFDSENPDLMGIGECSLIEGLSLDAIPSFEWMLHEIVSSIHLFQLHQPCFGLDLIRWPALAFGLEMARLDFLNGGIRQLYKNTFSSGTSIPINGLIWMGDRNFMKAQIDEKIESGFDCIKLKIGAIDFEEELALLDYIRSHYSVSQIQLRVDANGAFSPEHALERLKQLAVFDLHSIEQPIQQGNWEAMGNLCRVTPLPIALDEELIGTFRKKEKRKMLETIRPQFIILKPSLHGGFIGCEEWIEIATDLGIKWWATSALESNLGLNAIAQWVSRYNSPMHQGLGTGALYTNNIDSPLVVSNGTLSHYTSKDWDLTLFYS